MEFVYESKRAQTGVHALENALSGALIKHSRVLWLVCGGSSIPRIATVMQSLPDSLTSKLHIMLTDERFGAVGHADSNFLQLEQAGFDPKQALFIPTLHAGLSLTETAAHSAEQFKKEAAQAGYIIATFGIGADGHIAGILPGSPAATSQKLAAGYNAGTFERLSLTFPALKHIDKAYVFAYGAAKKPALLRLQKERADLIEQPCQILRHIPEAYVYNDCIA